MPFATMATPLTLLALALPFLFCFTQTPINNFWPLLASWVCGAVLVLLALARCGSSPGRDQGGETGRAPALVSSRMLAAGTYTVGFEYAGHRTEYWKGTLSLDAADSFVRASGETRHGIDAVLMPTK